MRRSSSFPDILEDKNDPEELGASNIPSSVDDLDLDGLNREDNFSLSNVDQVKFGIFYFNTYILQSTMFDDPGADFMNSSRHFSPNSILDELVEYGGAITDESQEDSLLNNIVFQQEVH